MKGWASLLSLLLTFLLAACGTFEVNARLMRPAEVTATAQAALTPSPTPAPRLGKIAFVRGGDLWVLDLDTGRERRLTQGIRIKRPTWSPSGRRIAFFKDRQLWTVSVEEEAPRRISAVAVTQAAWSPVEDRLAYVTANGGLWVTDVATMTSQELVSAPGLEGSGVGHITWSPDGQWLAFEWTDARPGEPPTYQGIQRIRVDGTHRSEVFSAYHPPRQADTVVLAGWSPDGSRLAFWRVPAGSASLAADGVPLQTVSAGGGTPVEIAAAVVPHPDFVAWSPDGARLAVVAGSGRETWQNKRLMVATADDRRRFLTPPTAVVLAPAWSPDGQRLAYVGAPAGPNVAGGEAARGLLAGRRIWVTGADAAGARPLTDDAAFRDERPLWSAEGTHILFARLQGRQAGLWLMESATGALRPVVKDLGPFPDPSGFYGYLDWSELFDWWTGPPRPPEAVHIPPPALPTAPPPAPPPTPVVVPSPTPTLPPPALGPTRPYTDTVLGLAFDVSTDWEVEGVAGAEAHFIVRDEAGNPRQVLDLSVLSPESRTLDRALAEVEQGAWRRYLRAAEPVRLGAFAALWLTLMPGEGRPMTVWLVIAPSGRGVTFVPGEEVATVEAVLRTLRYFPNTQR